jgi:hypothetical protein
VSKCKNDKINRKKSLLLLFYEFCMVPYFVVTLTLKFKADVSSLAAKELKKALFWHFLVV